MSQDFMHHVIRAMAHSAGRQRRMGNHARANGIILIALGIITLPIPIVGIPLILWGARKMLN